MKDKREINKQKKTEEEDLKEKEVIRDPGWIAVQSSDKKKKASRGTYRKGGYGGRKKTIQRLWSGDGRGVVQK